MPKLKQFPNESFTMCEGQHEYKFFNDIANPSYIKNRVDRIFNKEPETIQWIQSIPQDAVFFDIGANRGQNIDYYLAKADIVIAIEANPILINDIRDKHSKSIKDNRLFTENCVLTASKISNSWGG